MRTIGRVLAALACLGALGAAPAGAPAAPPRIRHVFLIVLENKGFSQTFGASKRQILAKVVLPGSIPTLIAALKVNVGLSLVGVVVGEFQSANIGLGFLIQYGSQIETHYGKAVDEGHLFDADFTPDSLIHCRRIKVPVPNHHRPCFQRRYDHLSNQL